MMNIFRLYCLKIDVSSFPYENELVLLQANLFVTPLKINMEHNHGGLEDHAPFQMGDL